MIKQISILLVSFLITSNIYSQESESINKIHFSNPIALYNKIGVKFEHRKNQTSYLVFATQYFNTIPPYPGTQLGLELRRYLKNKPSLKSEIFLYSKLIGGHQNYRSGTGSSFLAVKEVPEGNYYGLGFGVGRHMQYKKLFIEISTGFKGVLSTVEQENPFYITGPGSIFDLHFNFGFIL
jgi:hypothetical protein